MKHHPITHRRSTRRGFTLVEVLVVISIIAVLAAIVTSVARKMQSSAQSSTRLSNMRQSGSMLLALASERNGRCSFFHRGGSTGWYFRPYIMLRKELRLPDNDQSYVEIMHWDRKKLPAATPHWTCRATNFQDVTYPDGTTTRWSEEEYTDPNNGRKATVKSISLASVSRPDLYPLLIDSSRSDGSEIFRINEGNGDCVGLREAGGKASAFMFDGSARLLDKAELKKAGFTRAYDNSVTPPTSVTL